MSSRSSGRFTNWRRALRRRLRTYKRVWIIRMVVAGAVLIIVTVVVLVIVIGRPVSAAIRGWQARRLSHQAMALMDRRQWDDAAKKTRDALIIRPSEPVAWEAAARLLSKTGQGSIALTWWNEINRSRELNISERRDYASAALNANELSLAAKQIDVLRAQESSPVDLCLTAELATLRGDSQGAVTAAERVMADKRTEPGELFIALSIDFLNASPDSPSYLNALDRLVELARTNDSTIGLEALRLLAKSPPRPRLTDSGNMPVSIVSKDIPIPRSELADRLEHHPNARPADRLLALGVRLQEDPNREEDIKKAIESFRKGDDEHIAALSSWLYETGRFQTMLEILTPQLVARKGDLFIERIDALAALGRFADLATMLSADNLAIDEISQDIFLAVVRTKLGEMPASENEWARAMQTASTTPQFLRIAQYAEVHGVPDVADSAYKKILMIEPKSRSAHLARLRLTESMGRTADARTIATEIVKLWPDDTANSIHDWYLRLLLGSSPDETAEIEKDVEDLLSRKPLGSEASATLALAHLRSGRPAAALSAFTYKDMPVALATPSSMTVHAAALAANGWKDAAREEAKKLITAKLLPEERALIAPLSNVHQE